MMQESSPVGSVDCMNCLAVERDEGDDIVPNAEIQQTVLQKRVCVQVEASRVLVEGQFVKTEMQTDNKIDTKRYA